MPSWSQFTSPPLGEDPAVATVEQMLSAVSRQSAGKQLREETAPARHALAICACVTTGDAPTWLMYEAADGRLVWCRVPDGVDSGDLVHAQLKASGHADPAEVLRWLRREVADPWGRTGDGGGDPEVLDALRDKIKAG